MTKYEFREHELSEKAFGVYSDSDFTFYKKDGVFYMGYNPKETPSELGTLEDVENFLLDFPE